MSAHGFGHLAMTAPVLNLFASRYAMRLTIRTKLPESLIKSRLECDFEYVAEASDFGMVMKNSLDVNLSESFEAYQSLHDKFDSHVEAESKKLIALQPDLVLANIPYITICAAKRSAIPCVAYGSLNWAEIFKDYFLNEYDAAEKIYQEMSDAYNMANTFICPAPSMPMPQKNIKRVGPVAKVSPKITEFREQLGLDKSTRIILVSPGGVATPIPINQWPKMDDTCWIAAWPIENHRLDVLSSDQLPFSFNQILVNSDAVVSKPGYGTVTETVCNGIPVLYSTRGNWAEEPELVKWWAANGQIREISRSQLYSGEIEQDLRVLFQQSPKKPVIVSGITEIADYLSVYL